MVQPPPSSASADPGASEVLYGLEELLAVAGERLGEEITPRTVRLYATEGLIDRPGKESNVCNAAPSYPLVACCRVHHVWARSSSG